MGVPSPMSFTCTCSNMLTLYNIPPSLSLLHSASTSNESGSILLLCIPWPQAQQLGILEITSIVDVSASHNLCPMPVDMQELQCPLCSRIKRKCVELKTVETHGQWLLQTLLLFSFHLLFFRLHCCNT